MTDIPKREEWDIVKLASVCNFQNGYAFKNSDYQVSGHNAYFVFKMGNIERGGGLKQDPSNSYISRGKCESLSRFVLNKGDLAMSMTDMKASMALLGHTAVIDESDKYILNQRVGRITVRKPDILDGRFLFYYTNSPAYIAHLRGVAHSGVQVNLSTEAIKESPIVLPSLTVQRKISTFLLAYDDLIENNLRRIKILEEMAQTLYREWFVKFRFPAYAEASAGRPGHQKVKMVNSPLGKIPEGWEVKKATDAIAVNPTTKVPREGEKPFVSMGNLSNDSMLINGLELRSGNSGSKFRNGDTLFARITPCLENGKTAYVQFLPSDSDVAFGSTEFIVLRSKTLCPELVYFMARSNEFRGNAIKSMSGASGRQRVQEACFDKFLFAHPDPNTVSMFAEQIAPIFRHVHTLSRKNGNLRQTRDLLLPKLISGELDVSELDIETVNDGL